MKKFIIMLALLGLVGCTNEKAAIKALDGAGYSNIRITGYKFFGCSEDDLYHTGFTATGPTGKPVTGVVCDAPLKSSTIRLD